MRYIVNSISGPNDLKIENILTGEVFKLEPGQVFYLGPDESPVEQQAQWSFLDD